MPNITDPKCGKLLEDDELEKIVGGLSYKQNNNENQPTEFNVQVGMTFTTWLHTGKTCTVELVLESGFFYSIPISEDNKAFYSQTISYLQPVFTNLGNFYDCFKTN